jgi:hypothetical protein
MSSINYCSITADKNICGVCWNECCFDPRNPVRDHIKDVAMMQLFRCGHGVCAPCFYKMSGLVLCTGDHCHIPYESATNTCQECNSDLCETCVSVHNCGANHLKKIVWIKKPFACPFCRDEGSSFLTSFGSSRRGKSANTLSQWLYEFCGNSASAISNLVKGRCNHPYLIMLRSIKKDAAEKKRIKVAKHKKAMRIARYLSRKAVMQVEHAQMVKDRKDQEDAKKPKLCESSRVRKPLSVLYTERNRNKTGKARKYSGTQGGTLCKNHDKMMVTKKRIERRLAKYVKNSRTKEIKTARHDLRRITRKMRRLE